MNITTENTFETAIVQSLIDNGGYLPGNALDYNPELEFFKYEVLHFLRETQTINWQKISELSNGFIKKWLYVAV